MGSIWMYSLIFVIFLQFVGSNAGFDSSDEVKGARFRRNLPNLFLKSGNRRKIGHIPAYRQKAQETLTNAAGRFISTIEALFKKIGLGSMFPYSANEWIKELHEGEENGLGVGWPMKAIDAIINGSSKIYNLYQLLFMFFILPFAVVNIAGTWVLPSVPMNSTNVFI